jgi:IclR family transcriptional regulator, KDG regulon repressor
MTPKAQTHQNEHRLQDAMPERGGLEIKSLIKALHLLKLFSPQRGLWTFDEMVAALGFHKSSVQRIVATLEQQGFLSKAVPRKSQYRLGPEIIFLGSVAEVNLDLRSIAKPAMNALVERVQETCYLCVVDRHQCLYIEKVECSQPLRIINAVGQRNPLHCTGVGKALLSGMSREEIDQVIAMRGLKAYTPNTITDRKRLMQEIRMVRKTGVAFDNEELNPGITCLAAPIRNNSGGVVASLSLSGPSQRFAPDAVRRFEDEIRAAAQEISYSLGFIEGSGS